MSDQWWQNRPEKPIARMLLLHGAGAPADSEWMNVAAQALQSLGLWVLRAEFDYMARRRVDGRKRPPPRAEKLLPELQARLTTLPGADDLPLFLAGKSMGGRLQTLLATGSRWPSALPAPAGVLALGYPFHPPGKQDRLRTDHFPDMITPLRIVQGSRDPMGPRALVDTLQLPTAVSLHWEEDGNHDLRPRGLRKDEVWAHLAGTLRAQEPWLRAQL